MNYYSDSDRECWDGTPNEDWDWLIDQILGHETGDQIGVGVASNEKVGNSVV